MVSSGIGAIGHCEKISGAKFDAKTTSFASFFDYMNDAMGRVWTTSEGTGPLNSMGLRNTWVVSKMCLRNSGSWRSSAMGAFIP